MPMKNIIEYYNEADNKIISLFRDLSDEEFTQVNDITKKSLRELIEHVMVYYNIYLEPKRGFKEIKNSYGDLSKDKLLDTWKELVNKFITAVLNGDETKKISMPVSKDKTIDVTFDEFFFAYTDHSTYHRGQMIDHYKLVKKTDKSIGTDYYGYLVNKYLKE